MLFTELALVNTPLVFRRAGVYARYWRYASVDELLLLAGAVTTTVVLMGAISLAAVQFLPSDPPLPRSIPLIFLLPAPGVMAGPRFALRLRVLNVAKTIQRHGAQCTATNRPHQCVSSRGMGVGDAGAMPAP